MRVSTRRGDGDAVKVSKGERFVLREGAYPRDAYEVVKVRGPVLTIVRASGGFLMRVPVDRFLQDFRAVTADDEVPRWERVTFTLDSGGAYEGITDGRLWNGWECPRFERSVVERIMRDTSEWILWEVSEDTGEFRALPREYALEGDEAPEEYWDTWSPDVIDGVTYFAVGAGSWCWWRKEEDEG